MATSRAATPTRLRSHSQARTTARIRFLMIHLGLLLLAQAVFAYLSITRMPSHAASASAASGGTSNIMTPSAADTFLIPYPARTTPSPTGYFRGVNLFGAWGHVDAFPTTAQLDYYRKKGLTTFRVPLLWEHLQPTLMGPLDPTYLDKMDLLVTEATARHECVIFTFINQGVYPARNGSAVGSAAVPAKAFSNVWQQLAIQYRGNAGVLAYDLMNEPYHDAEWPVHAQEAIYAIRSIDISKPIIVMPENESFTGYGLDNGFRGYQDPANSLWYEIHIYFDHDGSGQYAGSYDDEDAYPMVGVDRVRPFVQWCQRYGFHCYVGEYGIPGGWIAGDDRTTFGAPTNDPRWNVVLDNFLTHLDQHQISGTYWNGGPYGDISSAEPTNTGQDRPQMAVLEQRLGTWKPGK